MNNTQQRQKKTTKNTKRKKNTKKKEKYVCKSPTPIKCDTHFPVLKTVVRGWRGHTVEVHHGGHRPRAGAQEQLERDLERDEGERQVLEPQPGEEELHLKVRHQLLEGHREPAPAQNGVARVTSM